MHFSPDWFHLVCGACPQRCQTLSIVFHKITFVVVKSSLQWRSTKSHHPDDLKFLVNSEGSAEKLIQPLLFLWLPLPSCESTSLLQSTALGDCIKGNVVTQGVGPHCRLSACCLPAVWNSQLTLRGSASEQLRVLWVLKSAPLIFTSLLRFWLVKKQIPSFMRHFSAR